MIEKGKTPVLSKEELVDIGYQLVEYPLTGLYASAAALETMYQKLLDNQNVARIGRSAHGVYGVQ